MCFSMNKFYGKSYLYGGRQIGVTQGLGSEYIIAYYSQTGGKHRVRNYSKLKVYGTPEEAKTALDELAKEYDLAEIN